MKFLNTKEKKLKLVDQYETFVSVDGADDYYISSRGRLVRLIYDQAVIVPQQYNSEGEVTTEIKWNGDDAVTEVIAASLVGKAFLVNQTDLKKIGYLDGNKKNIDCRNLCYLKDDEGQDVLKDPEMVEHIRTYQLKSYYNLNDYRLNQLYYNCFTRCYNKKYPEKYKYYKDAEVCAEWYNDKYSFYKWVRNSFYAYPRKLELDKDLMSIWTGKRIYAPDNCCFIPARVNQLFRNFIYESNTHIKEIKRKNGSTTYLVNMRCLQTAKNFDTFEEARFAVKANKLALISSVLNEFNNCKFDGYDVPQNIIDALREWHRAIEADEINLTATA